MVQDVTKSRRIVLNTGITVEETTVRRRRGCQLESQRVTQLRLSALICKVTWCGKYLHCKAAKPHAKDNMVGRYELFWTFGEEQASFGQE